MTLEDVKTQEDLVEYRERLWERFRAIVHECGFKDLSQEYERVRTARINAILRRDWDMAADHEENLMEICRQATDRRGPLN